MVRAFRDTWELGIHSYLSYLRDRLLLARELLHDSGTCFVQISDENLHLVRGLMDEVFQVQNFISIIQFKKTAYQQTDNLPNVCDFLILYAKDKTRVKFRSLYSQRSVEMLGGFTWIENSDGTIEKAQTDPRNDAIGTRRFQSSNLTSQGTTAEGSDLIEYDGVTFEVGPNRHWKTHREGIRRLAAAQRLFVAGRTLTFKRYADDFPVTSYSNMWEDTVRSDHLHDLKRSGHPVNGFPRCIPTRARSCRGFRHFGSMRGVHLWCWPSGCSRARWHLQERAGDWCRETL